MACQFSSHALHASEIEEGCPVLRFSGPRLMGTSTLATAGTIEPAELGDTGIDVTDGRMTFVDGGSESTGTGAEVV